MTDTPTPERGEFSDLLDTLCSTWHQKEETDYDHMRGSCSTLDAARADFAYREARRLVVKHVDALRAECARLREQLREDRRDYAADSRMASAVIDVLRELMPNWESRFYDVPESTMAECAIYAIRQLAKLNPGAPRDGE